MTYYLKKSQCILKQSDKCHECNYNVTNRKYTFDSDILIKKKKIRKKGEYNEGYVWMSNFLECAVLEKKKKNKVTMAMYIHIRGYKTRQNKKGHNMHSKARLKNTENGEMLVYTCRTLQKRLRKIGCPNWDHT